MHGQSRALRVDISAAAPSDADCVRTVLAGDREAFRTLVERYQHAYMRFAMRVLGAREDADEAPYSLQ
jgi:hypothetical protein